MGSKATIILAVLLVAGVGTLYLRQQKFETAWQTERAALEQRLAVQQQQADAVAAQKAAATAETVRLQSQLAAATNELATAHLKVEAYEAKHALDRQAQVAEANKVADMSRIKAEVPTPVVTTSRDFVGKEQKTYTFPHLLAADGHALATDAEYRSQFGRRFVFKSGTGRPLAYDVAELHPGVLLHLGLSRESAFAAQAEIDRQVQAAEQSHQSQLAIKAEAEKRAAEQRAKLAVEYAKIAEERRKSQLEEQLKIQAAETERLKADAAMQEALRPDSPDYFFQQFIRPPNIIVAP